MDKKSQRTLEFDKILGLLAEHTSFSAGKSLALQLRPTSDLEEATRWQIETNEARILLDKQTDVTIGGARDVRRAAGNAQRGFILSAEDFLEVRSTVIAARDLRRKIIKLQDTYPNLAFIAELFEECPGLVSAISNTLDERGEVLDSASAELASIRRKLRIVHGRIHDRLRSLMNSEKNQFLQEPTVTTRGGRYVVPLQSNYRGRIRGIVHDQSNSGATLWIEPINTVELNNDYRALHLSEEEEIQRLLSELTLLVADHADAIIRIVERLAELDMIFARARYANSIDAVMPELVPWGTATAKSKPKSGAQRQSPESYNLEPGSTIWIKGARHPLLNPETVVPTDFLLEEDIHIVLITGPNTGGKTVSLKTMGLMVIMAQSGLHLPVVEAKLSVFENVFADIGDEQSIEQNLSTFSGHITNIIRILNIVDEFSLVLLDELGSGTDPTEGAALGQSIVSFLRDKGATTFVATHYPELKLYASQTKGATNASLLFDVDTLMPTYEMSIGVPGRSNAFAIARRLGLEDSVLDEAMKLVGAGNREAEMLLESIYEIREKISSGEAGTRLALRQAEADRSELQERLETIEQERQNILDETRALADSELADLRKEIRQMRKKVRDAKSISRLKKVQKQSEDVEKEILSSEEIAPIIPEPRPQRKSSKLQVGDIVKVTTLGVKGNIVSLGKYDAEVAVGRLHMRAALAELEFKERPDQNDEVDMPSVGRPKIASPRMELDIRGKRVDEGIQLVEQYLDTAFLAGLPWVRIIHGKGTGRLRQAVRDVLKQNDHVSSWEEGRDREGGAGVTVAKLALE
jgi:DNA mismatch repair protein MutS2